MKIFLAGCEGTAFARLVTISGHKTALFSYYHLQNTAPKELDVLFSLFNDNNMEIISDSGLFTMMFGAGKGGSYDLPFMREYTAKYIKTAKSWPIKNLTIVESDVHKILGMTAVHELRKQFEDSGLKVLYVWHVEEKIDGLLQICNKYDYVSLSVPELRVVFKEQEHRYQTAVFDLLRRIKDNCPVLPKIHLLGNTIQETMETSLAYSCDSTSWLSGVRWGLAISFQKGRLSQVKLSSDQYHEEVHLLETQYHDTWNELKAHYGHRDKLLKYMVSNFVSAKSYNRYQQHLDKFYPWEGLRNAK